MAVYEARRKAWISQQATGDTDAEVRRCRSFGQLPGRIS